jgi:hypothetical protein
VGKVQDRNDTPAAAEHRITGLYSLVALAVSTIFVLTIGTAAWVYYSQAPGVDFASFWAAGRLALSGTPALAYDLAAHRAVESTVVHVGGPLPFAYPPPFLFVTAAIAFTPFWLAYLFWMAVTAGLYLIATARVAAPRFAFAHPAAIVNAIIGQNGFLTTSIFLFGTSTLARNAFAGGVIFGLLIIKPQLGVLIPVALVAGREWRAIAGAAVSSSFLLALAALAFGSGTYAQFLEMSGQYASFMAADRWNWAEFSSIYGFVRFTGAPQPLALAAQGLAAAAATVITWHAWARQWQNRDSVLAASTLLVAPYLFTYDSLLLLPALASLLRDPLRPLRPAIVWLCLFAPLLGYVGLYPGPNTVPIGAGLCLWWLSRDGKKKAAAPPGAAAPVETTPSA